MTVPLTADALFATPDQYFFAFEAEEALFLPVDRDVYHRSLFLDDRIALEAGEIRSMPTQALAAHRAASGDPLPRIGWIFHIAHCGSTLLARALDRRDSSLVLREPLPLRQLGVEAAVIPQAVESASWRERLRLAVALAGRRYRSDAPTLVKANVPVNMILLPLMALDPAAPGILLHHPLEPYLLAILRSDAHRDWVMRVTHEIAPAITAWAGPIAGADVVERAAALWLAQMRIYDAALARHPSLRSLAAITLFETPRPVLVAAADHLGVTMTAGAIDEIVSGPLFASHAKQPGQAFDNNARRDRETQLARVLRPDLDRARRWIDERRQDFPFPERLARPLLGAGTMLIG